MIKKFVLISLLLISVILIIGATYTDRIEKGFIEYWVKGSSTAYVDIDSVYTNHLISSGNAVFSGTLDLTITNNTAAGERGINLNIAEDTVELTGTLDAMYARATGFGADNSHGRVQGLEIGARLPHGDGTKAVGEVVAGYFWADCKIGDVGTLRAVEASLDGGAGGTATTAVAFEAFNNTSAAYTTSIAYDVNEGACVVRAEYTYDMRMQHGETMDNATDGTVQIISNIVKQAYDAAAYWTATQADAGGVTFNSVSDGTAGFTFSDPITSSLSTGTAITVSSTPTKVLAAGSYASPINLAEGATVEMLTIAGETTEDDFLIGEGIYLSTTGEDGKGFGLCTYVEAKNTTGTATLNGGQMMAFLGTIGGTEAAHLKTRGGDATAGMYSLWLKTGANSNCVFDSGSRTAPLWVDNQCSGTHNGEEYGIFSSTGASRPDAWAGFETTSSGYSYLLYFDETFNSGAGICVTTDAVPGTQDARIGVYYDGKAYYIPLYR